MPIVTRDLITKMLKNPNQNYVHAVVGRALIVLFNNQTDDERESNITNKDNGIGFTGADAYSGCITAKYWLRHRKLKDWMVDNWTRTNKSGYPRLAKYHKQLNTAAQLNVDKTK